MRLTVWFRFIVGIFLISNYFSEKSTQMRDDRERERREAEKKKEKLDKLIGKYPLYSLYRDFRVSCSS